MALTLDGWGLFLYPGGMTTNIESYKAIVDAVNGVNSPFIVRSIGTKIVENAILGRSWGVTTIQVDAEADREATFSVSALNSNNTGVFAVELTHVTSWGEVDFEWALLEEMRAAIEEACNRA